MTTRHSGIDLLRATAISLMIVFHFFYDLNFLGMITIEIPYGQGWKLFRVVIVFSFLLVMGMSLSLAYPTTIQWKIFIKRQAILAVSAVAISIATLYFIQANWIYFGIIHFIFLASLLVIPFRHKPTVALALSVIIVVVYLFSLVNKFWPFHFFGNTFPINSNDYISIFPWLAVPFLGVWLVNQPFIHQAIFKYIALPHWVKWISRHSLIIYLLHQPLMLLLLTGVKSLYVA